MESVHKILKIMIGIAITASLGSTFGMQQPGAAANALYYGLPFLLPLPVPPERGYGHGPEAAAVKEELGDFDCPKSRALKALQHHFGSNLRLKELKGILLSIICFLSRKGVILPKPSRNTKRSFPLMIKYIDEHYGEIAPIFPDITLLNADRQPIPFLDAGKNWGRSS
ncbi:MAG: hypothetical protein LBC04_04195 [Holosporaceae bacterium]|jgi:hypothetical protein|nr:hypothetical protein [Holosporaceae bacterium]